MRSRGADNPLKKLILPIYLPGLIFSTGIGAINPILVLAALAIGFDDAGSSAVVGVFGVVGIVLSPIIGRVITRIGDRVALIRGGVLALAALGMAIAAVLVGDSFAMRLMYTAALILLGIAQNTWSLARQAYIAESLPVEYRARGLSTLGGMIRFGMLIGPLASSGMLALWWLHSVFVLHVVLTMIALALVIVFVVPDPELDLVDMLAKSRTPAVEPPPKKTSRGATAIMGVAMNALNVLRANRSVIVPLWGTYLGYKAAFITGTFAVTALLDAIMFIVSGSLMDKRGRHWALLPSLTVMPLGIAVMLLWTTPVGFVVGAGIIGFGNGFGSGVVMTTGADLSPSTNRANFLGIWQAIVAIGMAAGPFVVSGMTKLVNLQAALWLTAAIGIAGALWVALLIRPAYRKLGLDLKGQPLNDGEPSPDA